MPDDEKEKTGLSVLMSRTNDRITELEKKLEGLSLYTHREVPDNYGYIINNRKEIAGLKEKLEEAT